MLESRKKTAMTTGYGLKATVLRQLSDPIDGRSRLGRALDELQADLTASLGGAESLSKQQELLVVTVTRTWLLLESLDKFILTMDCPVNRKRRAAYPIVEQRARLAESLLRQLQSLGLQRVPKPVKSLAEYIAEREEKKNHQDEPEPPEVDRDSEPAAEQSEGAQ